MDNFPAWVVPFLDQLRLLGQVSKAARAVGIKPSQAYSLRESSAEFAAACDEALEEAIDELEAEARRRATHGLEEPVVYQGAISYQCERDERGEPVAEVYDTGVPDKDGNPVMGTRLRLKLDDKGRPIPVTIRKPSDALLMFLLKGRRKKVFAERTELTGPEGTPVQIDEQTRAARLAQIVAAAQARRDEHARLAEQFEDIA